MKLKIKKISEYAIIPTTSYTDVEAGLDFYASAPQQILPHSKAIVSTGIALEIPKSAIATFKGNFEYGAMVKFYMKLYSRSGLSAKKGIEVGAGVIDSSYRGEIKVVLFNHSDEVFIVKTGDKIAQGVLYMIPCYDIEVCDELSESNRGEKGFGSSDKKA